MSIVAVTGHRPHLLGGYSDEVYQRLLTLAQDNIPDGTSRIISGLALGFDQAVAEAAILMGIPVTGAIPFNGQQAKWPANSQEKYLDICGKCDKIEVVSNGGYAPWKMIARDKWMVDRCDILLALWNGTKSGTGHTVSYCMEKFPEKQIINLWEKWNGI